MEIQPQKVANNLSVQNNEVNQQRKINIEQKPDEVVLSSKDNKKTENKKKKIAIGIGIGIAAAAVTGFAIYKGKQIKALKQVPEDLKPLFNDLKGKNGKEFVDDAYSGLVKHMGLDGIAPSKVNITNESSGLSAATGGFNYVENTIEYSKGFIDNLTKKQQFNMLSHELKHCDQFNKILRTEGLGAEALASASAERAVYKSSGIFGNYAKIIKKEYPKEEAEKIIKDKVSELTQEYTAKIKKNFSKTFELPKISASSKEGIKAKEYLEAQRNYSGLTLGLGSKEYMENLLEKEAYAYGDKAGKWFGASSSLPEKIKDYFRVLKNSKQ